MSFFISLARMNSILSLSLSLSLSLCRKSGRSCSLVCVSSMLWCRRDVSLVLLAGTSHMSSMRLTYEYQSNSSKCSSMNMRYICVHVWHLYMCVCHYNYPLVLERAFSWIHTVHMYIVRRLHVVCSQITHT